jgi:hypothetical protein
LLRDGGIVADVDSDRESLCPQPLDFKCRGTACFGADIHTATVRPDRAAAKAVVLPMAAPAIERVAREPAQ